MTSTFASSTASARGTVHASAGVRALAIGMLMQCVVVLPPRSPAPGRP
jgi:hypothetical protein